MQLEQECSIPQLSVHWSHKGDRLHHGWCILHVHLCSWLCPECFQLFAGGRCQPHRGCTGNWEHGEGTHWDTDVPEAGMVRAAQHRAMGMEQQVRQGQGMWGRSREAKQSQWAEQRSAGWMGMVTRRGPGWSRECIQVVAMLYSWPPLSQPRWPSRNSMGLPTSSTIWAALCAGGGVPSPTAPGMDVETGGGTSAAQHGLDPSGLTTQLRHCTPTTSAWSFLLSQANPLVHVIFAFQREKRCLKTQHCMCVCVGGGGMSDVPMAGS